MNSASSQKDSSFNNANGIPRLPDGRTMHLQVREQDVANRILSVGSAARAKLITEHFDDPENIKEIQSSRGFTVYTGTYQQKPVSVVATGMGIANMDFVVRECAAVVQGPMAMIRFGTAGALQPNIDVGTICVASPGAVMIMRNPDAFDEASRDFDVNNFYTITSKVAAADPDLTKLLVENLKESLGESVPVCETLNCTCCSFYSSQGRDTPMFEDYNEDLHQALFTKHPNVGTMEMETFQLLDLARCSRSKVRAAACVIAIINRSSASVVSKAACKQREKEASKAILSTLVSFDL